MYPMRGNFEYVHAAATCGKRSTASLWLQMVSDPACERMVNRMWLLGGHARHSARVWLMPLVTSVLCCVRRRSQFAGV
jgi:hypothetical protein